MSYSTIKLQRESFFNKIDAANPLYLPMGAMSAADATTLNVHFTVGAITGDEQAWAYLFESWDEGVNWTPVLTVPILVDIQTTGPYGIKVSSAHGAMAPLVKLQVEAVLTTELYITEVNRTFVQSSVMVPRDIVVSVTDAATETTLLAVKDAIDLTTAEVTTVKTAVDLTTTAVDLVTAEVTTVKTAVDLTTTAVDLVTAEVTTVKTAVDLTTTAVDLVTAEVTTVKTAVDLTTTAVDLVTAEVTTVKTAVDLTTTAVNLVTAEVTTVKTAVDLTTTAVGSTNTLLTDRLGGSLINFKYDCYEYTSNATSDVYVYKTGGISGTVVGTITINYTDITKAVQANAVRT